MNTLISLSLSIITFFSIQTYSQSFCLKSYEVLMKTTKLNPLSVTPSEDIHQIINCLSRDIFYDNAEGAQLLHEELFYLTEKFPYQVVLELSITSPSNHKKLLHVMSLPLHDGINIFSIAKNIASLRVSPSFQKFKSTQKDILIELKRHL